MSHTCVSQLVCARCALCALCTLALMHACMHAPCPNSKRPCPQSPCLFQAKFAPTYSFNALNPHVFLPYRVAAAPYGGPLATVRDERLVLQLGAGASLRPVIRTFTASGAELGSMVWERGHIVEWGWSERLELVIVEANGKVGVHLDTACMYGRCAGVQVNLIVCLAMLQPFGGGCSSLCFCRVCSLTHFSWTQSGLKHTPSLLRMSCHAAGGPLLNVL